MIYFLAKRAHQYTWRRSIENAYANADPAIRKELFERVELLPYERLFTLRHLPLGAYVFADLERLSPEETERAGIVWRTLDAAGPDVRLFNHPSTSMRRFELLRHLHEDGTNAFNVQRLTEPLSLERFPVFIRSESDHSSSITPLLHNRQEYDRAVQEIIDSGKNRDDKIVVEYLDARDDTGLSHRFSVIVADAQVLAMFLAHEPGWVVKKLADQSDQRHLMRREYKHHATEIRRIFHLAKIDYGRIDYAVVDNKIQVFEINTNPSLGPADYLLAVVRALDMHSPSGRVAVSQAYRPPWSEKKKKRRSFYFSRQLHLALRKMGLLGYESAILNKASALKSAFTTKTRGASKQRR